MPTHTDFVNRLTLGASNALGERSLIGRDFLRVKAELNRTTGERDITRADVERACTTLGIQKQEAA